MKEATGIDTSILASKTDLAILKTKVNYLNVDKPKTVRADLSKLSYVVDNDIVKKIIYDKLFTKVKTIDTKIPNTDGLVNKTQYNSENKVLKRRLKM